MKETKTIMRLFAFYDRTNLVQFLEEQSEQGWLLTGISLGYKFRRVEPKKRHFCVVYLPKASSQNTYQWEFLEYCQHAGWALLVANQQMHVFCSERDNPVSIETDPTIEVENIHKSAKKTHLTCFYIELFVGMQQLVHFLMRLMDDDLSHTLSRPIHLFNLFLGLLIIALSLVEIFGYFHWHQKAKDAAVQGMFTPTPDHSVFRSIILLILLVMLIMLPIVSYFSYF
jgi:uncharacterized membrane protein YidH (DUF202 family)